MEPLSTLIEAERNFFTEVVYSLTFQLKYHTSAFWPHTSVPISDNTNGNIPFLLQENSYTDGNDGVFFPTSSGKSYLSVSCSRGSQKGISVIPSAEFNNLSPNSKKHSCSLGLEDVDISTTLEEAVEYVKFLQLQIKLLSSDDLWMYAPIAYNGMDLGLHVELPSPR